MKTLVLFSGGLDSSLAISLLLEQGLEVEAANFVTPFCACQKKGGCGVAASAAKFKIKLHTFNVAEAYLPILKNPKYGYGSHMNPCLDCRILMFKKAKVFLGEIGASFITTGEVLGQRPMSQHLKAMQMIERDSALEGLILRPLSAKILPETIPEKNGWVNREKLLSISGRSRKEQIEYAAQKNIIDYPCPAGGCLLTDPGFSKRLKDLFKYEPNWTLRDISLLKLGRHFRLSPQVKLIVGRCEEENKKIESFKTEEDLIMEVLNFSGPISLLKGLGKDLYIPVSAGITLRYSDAPKNESVDVYIKNGEITKNIVASSIEDTQVKNYII
ncbi:MAG: hypothetical protein AABY84_02140 [Candidatus Firestonebacteria bacterium]